jgi:hypothetical protein
MPERQAGALEIEITPAMLDAGAKAISRQTGSLELMNDFEEIADEVFRRMIEAQSAVKALSPA